MINNQKKRLIYFWINLGILLFISTSLFAKVFESKDEALKDIFKASGTLEKVNLELNNKQKKYLEKELGSAGNKKEFIFYLAKEDGKVKGYATIVWEFGKDGYNKLLVAITTEGKVDTVKVLESRDQKGKEISKKRFLRQFEGKGYKNRLKINRDVMAITGATISSRAAARAVKKSLLIWEIFFHQESNNDL
ncbi:MAG: FMN-binding protein [Candidatus Omnitrophica bacterium]|nr:FMN-binding protein [Candidatus Omnitrophota bacterium]